MSSKIQEKQQQKDNKRDFDADDIFNQQLFKTLAYTGAGFGAGLVASIFLKNRKALSLIGAGTGAAYGYTNFMSELNSLNKFKDMANQATHSQQPQTLKRADPSTKNWDEFMPKQENLQQKQHRYGGSDDDHNKEKRQESKSNENKSTEQKEHKGSSLSRKEQQESASKSNASSSKENKSQEQHHQQKGDSQKNVSLSRNVPGEKNLTAGSESKSPNLGAQNLQDFKTNPGPGKPAKGEDGLHRGAERNVRGKNELDDLSNQQSRMVKQDQNYKSVRTGNKMKVEHPPENIAGGQFSGKGLTAGSQVNAVIE